MIIRIRKQGKRTTTDRKRMAHSARKSLKFLQERVRAMEIPEDLEEQVALLQKKFDTR